MAKARSKRSRPATRQQVDRFLKDAVILFVSMILTEPLLTPSQVRHVSILQKRGRRLMGETLPRSRP